MKVLKPTTDEQTFYFIPKYYEISAKLFFRDDQTNEVVEYNPTMIKVNDFIKVTGVFNLREGHFYDMSLVNNFDIWNENLDLYSQARYNWNDEKRTENLVVDKIFCTAQPIDQNLYQEYTINKGVYKTDDSFDNDYIIL
jgi:hypothetical protein